MEGITMKPMEAWEMEAVFIFVGIVILLVAGGIALLALKSIQIQEQKAKEEQTREESPCDWCLRWMECNGVDDNCPIKEADGNTTGGGSQ
jgi:hypothetical protein